MRELHLSVEVTYNIDDNYDQFMGATLIMDVRHEFSYKRPTIMVTIKKSKKIRQIYLQVRRLQIYLFLPIIIGAIAGLL